MNENVEPMNESKVCSNCKRDVGLPNYDIHVAHCQRHVVICEKCSEPVYRREMESHLATAHAKAACKKCQKQIEAWQIEDHKESCIKRLIPCIYCNEDCPWDGIKEHESYCGSRTELCEHCNNRVLRKDLDDHMERCQEQSSNLPKFTVCPFCGLHMMPQLAKTHIAICIRNSRTNKLAKEADQQMQHNLWTEQEMNKEVDSQSLNAVVESMARLTTSEGPAPKSDAKYAPMVPILSGGDIREGRHYQTGAKTKTAPQRLRNNSPETDTHADNRKNEDFLSQLQNLRQPLPASDTSRDRTAEETVPKQITQEIIGDRSNIMGIGRGYQRIHKSKSLATPGGSTVAMKSPSISDGNMDLELSVDCPICKEKIDVEVIRNHVYICKELQRKRPAKETCPFCFTEITPRDKDNHINSCKMLHEMQKEDLGLKDGFTQDSRKKKKGKSKQHERQNERVSFPKPDNDCLLVSKVPCEFCQKPIPFHRIIEHQAGCRPDLMCYSRREQHGEIDDQPDVIPDQQDSYHKSTTLYKAHQDRSHIIQTTAVRSVSPGIVGYVGQLRNPEESGNDSPSKDYGSRRNDSPSKSYVTRSPSRTLENINNPSASRSLDFDSYSGSIISQACTNQPRGLSNQEYADHSRNPGMEDKYIYEQQQNSDNRESTSQQKYKNENKTMQSSYHDSEDNFNVSRDPDHMGQNTSIVLYNSESNQNSARSDNYQSLHLSFQGRGGKRRGSYHQKSNRYDRNVTPGEFLTHFSPLSYPAYPDCYQTYNSVPVPPPYPGRVVYFAAAMPNPAYPVHSSYADAVKKGPYESSYHLYDQEKRWRRGSGTYESLSSELDEFKSLEEDESDKSSCYASCQSDFDSNGQRQESHLDQALGSGSDSGKEEKSASIPTRSPRRNPTKKTRKDKKSNRGGRRK